MLGIKANVPFKQKNGSLGLTLPVLRPLEFTIEVISNYTGEYSTKYPFRSLWLDLTNLDAAFPHTTAWYHFISPAGWAPQRSVTIEPLYSPGWSVCKFRGKKKKGSAWHRCWISAQVPTCSTTSINSYLAGLWITKNIFNFHNCSLPISACLLHHWEQ